MKGRGGGGRGSPERILPGLPECSGWLDEEDDVADAAGATTRRRPERRRGGGGRRGDDDEAARAAPIEAAPARRGAQRARTREAELGLSTAPVGISFAFFLAKGISFACVYLLFFMRGACVYSRPTDPPMLVRILEQPNAY